jgi:hypothetical protein
MGQEQPTRPEPQSTRRTRETHRTSESTLDRSSHSSTVLVSFAAAVSSAVMRLHASAESTRPEFSAILVLLHFACLSVPSW